MTKKNRAWSSVVTLGLIALGTTQLGMARRAEAVPVGYQLVWSDEFAGTQLDTTKWNYRNLGPRVDGVNTVDAVKLDGVGHLNINSTAVPNGTGGYTYQTGMIGTQGLFEHAYGYWEARMDMPNLQSKWSAFWLQSPTIGQKVADTFKSGTEIDVVEYSPAFGKASGVTLQSTLHWDGYGADHKTVAKVSTLTTAATAYHTYGVLWTPAAYTFYIDDVPTWTTTQAISGAAQFAILSTEIGTWGGALSPSNTPDTLAVDYVRVYDTATGLTAAPEPASAMAVLLLGGLVSRRPRRPTPTN